MKKRYHDYNDFRGDETNLRVYKISVLTTLLSIKDVVSKVHEIGWQLIVAYMQFDVGPT